MNHIRLSRIAAIAVFAMAMIVPVTFAQTPEYSVVNFDQPTLVGDTVLQPGQYLIRALPKLETRNQVQITDVNRTKIYTTVLTVPHALEPNEEVPNTRLVFYPNAAGDARALRTWFPQGAPREEGHDIVYEQSRAKALARASNENVVSYTTATDTTYNVVTPQETMTVYVPPTPSMTTTTTVTTPSTTMSTPSTTETTMESTTETRTELPRTAGNGPLLALLGAVAIAGAVAFRFFNR